MFDSNFEIFKLIMDQIHHAVFVINPDNFRFEYVNTATCEHFGYSKQKLMSMAIPDWDPNYNHATSQEVCDRVRREKKLVLETTHKLSNGQVVPVQITTSAFEFAGKDFIVGLIYNISERKQTEATLKQSQENLALALSFREKMMSVLGHDLRNPLGAIQGLTQLLSSSNGLSQEERQFVVHIMNAANRMEGIIKTVLDFASSRFGNGIPIALAPMDFYAACQNIVTELRAAWPKRKIEVELSGDGLGESDEGRFGQIVANLVSNALTHGAPDSPVQVSVQSDDLHVIVQVRNLGPPIPSHLIAQIFEPFRQGPPQKGAGSSGGLGLGLYIVKGIVEALHGTIAIESNLENGTVFTVTLPRRSGKVTNLPPYK